MKDSAVAFTKSESPTVKTIEGVGSKNASFDSKHIDSKIFDVAVKTRSRITREMVIRANEDGVLPHEWLFALAVDPSLTFTDWVYDKEEHQWIAVERGASLEERIQCARDIAPYYKAKKISVQHEGQIQILHAIARTSLDDDEELIEDNSDEIIEGDYEEKE